MLKYKKGFSNISNLGLCHGSVVLNMSFLGLIETFEVLKFTEQLKSTGPGPK